jgi:uncharacterized Zn finger protein (UPF0148 family)
MASTSCPNCGKPLRPGARFCGSCGHVLSAPLPAQKPASPPLSPSVEQPAPTAQAAGAAVEGGDWKACPHCGKPLRVGAKFCNNCGKSITPSGPIAEAPQPIPAPPPKPALSRMPAQKTAQAAQPARATPPLAARAAASKQPARTGLRVVVIAILLVVCVAALGGGYYAYTQFGSQLFGKGTSVADVPTGKPSQSPEKPTAITEAPPTKEPVTEASPTSAPPTQEMTAEPEQPTDTPLPSETPPIQVRQVMDENFTGDPGLNWIVWGTLKPRINSKENPPYMELKSGDKPDASGITSLITAAYRPGAEIEFEASLHPIQGLTTIFYWDPQGYVRAE